MIVVVERGSEKEKGKVKVVGGLGIVKLSFGLVSTATVYVVTLTRQRLLLFSFHLPSTEWVLEIFQRRSKGRSRRFERSKGIVSSL